MYREMKQKQGKKNNKTYYLMIGAHEVSRGSEPTQQHHTNNSRKK